MGLDQALRFVVAAAVSVGVGEQFLLPTGEGGAKRRMRGVCLAKTLFVNAFFVTGRPSPAASRHPLPVGEGN
jgi:hypothetical protein